ncbi:hypothetical protein FHS89_002949 [Rubricella aquisinus]|uniref:Uncharacterized protein n=1 Tax=Rubricella aquisinus TaxID=2028108 RepID=A0A840X4Z1_9RHOB|nr:hypothetical protein [Rubricella aquisinus]MBB5516905.1 hypothetical protein [Rubricella aquisinus]
MILKIISLFLIGMLVLGMFGKLRVGGFGKLPRWKRTRVAEARKCPHCQAYLIGDTPCACSDR